MLYDLRQAIRGLRATPGYSALALIMLALGIGSTTLIFSVADAVVLRRLPFEEGDRLVSVTTRNTTTGRYNGAASPQDFLDWSARQDVFAWFAATAYGESLTMREGGRTELLRVHRVTPDFFEVVRVRPRLGRPFTVSDTVEGSHRVAILSDALWRRRFGADPAIVGRSVTASEAARSTTESWLVIGVMPPGFAYPIGAPETADVLVPLVFQASARERGDSQSYYLQLIARLRDGVTVEQADAQLGTITDRLAQAFPAWFRDSTSAVRPLYAVLFGALRPWMLTLLGAVGLVLTLVCINVANLSLVRGLRRAHDMRVRVALGASGWQIARVLVLESLLLSIVGSACAVTVAWLGSDLVRAALPQGLPRLADVGLDTRVLGFAVAMAIGTGLAIGLVPALRLSRLVRAGSLGSGRRVAGASNPRLGSVLVITQVSLAVVLVAGAALFTTSFARVISVDLGINPRRVLTATVQIPFDFSNPDAFRTVQSRTTGAVPDMVERVRAIPGVEEAAFIAGGSPLSGSRSSSSLEVPGRGRFHGPDAADVRVVTPGYHVVMGTPLQRGRLFTKQDGLAAPHVAILSEEAAKRYFGDLDPLGATIRVRGLRTVVGIVANVRLSGPEVPAPPEIYVPVAQGSALGGELVVRTLGDADTFGDSVREVIAAALPDAGIPEVTSMEVRLAGLLAARRFNMFLMGLFGLLALAVAAVGIYGVMAQVVAIRVREFGVRMALGARPGQVLGMVLKRAGLVIGSGVVIGAVTAWFLVTFVERLLFDVDARDPLSFAAAIVILALSGLAAAFVPARGASRIDPVTAIRTD